MGALEELQQDYADKLIESLKQECADKTDQIIELKSQIKELNYKLDRLTIIKDVYESYLDSDDLFADITLEQAALILSEKLTWVKKVEE